MRQRTLASVLLSLLPTSARSLDQLSLADWPALSVLDTDDHGPLSARMKAFDGYTRSTLEPGVPNGASVPSGATCADLEDLPFTSNSFDIIMTSDVMEHVRHDDAAHAEIFRCLRPGGTYIFTVPYDGALSRTRRLVDTSGRRDVYLEPPHFHGDPIRGGILAYRIYGPDLLEQLADIGFNVEERRITEPTSGIFDGDVFIATKGRISGLGG